MRSISKFDLPFGKRTKWLTTYVESGNGHIFCQLNEPSVLVKYERVQQSIKGLANAGRLQKITIEPAIGEVYLVRFSEDGIWYRSQVTQIDGETRNAEVYFLDSGNTDVFPFDEIYELPAALSELPPQAKECILAYVEPSLNGEWSERAIELIKELVLDQELCGVAMRLHHNLLVLKLYADIEGTITVAEQLISAGFGQEKRALPIGSACGSSLVRSSSISSINSSGSKKSNDSSSGSNQLTRKYLSTRFSPEQYVDLCVVFCYSIDKFYCQLVTSKTKIDNLQNNLQELCLNNNGMLLKSFKLNQPCCAKYPEDQQWYRGLVKNISNDSCNIFFVDYGNAELIKKSDIKEMKQELLALPAGAIECSLSGIKPLPRENKFSDKAKGLFETLTMDNESMVGLISKMHGDKVEVVVYDKQDQPISQILIAKGLVAPIDVHEVSMMVNNSSSSHSNPIVSVIKYVPQLVTVDSEEPVFVSFSNNPHNFYVNLVSTSNALIQLMADINKVYKNENVETIKKPIVDQPCATTFSEDNEYYRGVITEVNASSAKVLFVDYGNFESKSLDMLKVLRKEFIKLPKQGILCKLDDVESLSDTFSTDACQKFEELTVDQNLTMSVNKEESGIHIVRLDDQSGVDIAKAMVQTGLMKQGGILSKKGNPGSAVLEVRNFNELKIDVNCYMDVAPVDVVNPGQFCCHVVQNGVEFKRLTEELINCYSKSSVDQSIRWQKLMPCVALYDVDGCWYRATVTSVIGKTAMEVAFVDFGNSATVSVENIRPIYSNFMNLPAQVFVCSLADVAPVASEICWNDQAIEEFQHLVLDKHLAAYVKSKNADNSFSIVLYDTKSSPEVNISQLLIKKKHAKSTDSKESLLGCGKFVESHTTEQVVVTALLNPLTFWLQLNRLSSQLDKMMDDLHDFYSKLSSTDLCVIDPMIGQYCCAKFTEDDGWYRAIVEEVNGSTVLINYIDYGNSESLSIDRIKVLDADFDFIPRFALPCKLSGVSSQPSWDKSVNKVLLNKEFKAKFFTKTQPYTVELMAGSVKVNDVIHNMVDPKIQHSTSVNDSNTRKNENTNDSTPASKLSFIQSELAETESGYCTFVLSATEVKFQLGKYESQLNQLMESLASFSPTAPVLTPCQVMSCCSAKYTVDEQWYRAEVISVDKGQAVVNFIDYGNTESVDIQSLKSLTPAFTSLPRTCVTCILHDVHPDDIDTEKAKNWIEENILEQPVNLEVRRRTGTAIEGYIFSTNVEGHINDYLYSLFAKEVPEEKTPVIAVQSEQIEATPTQIEAIPATTSSRAINIQLPTLTADTNVNATCYVVDSAIILRCQLSEYQERIDTMMNEVADVAESSPVLNDPKPGDICLAKYTEDEGWYRGQITQDKKVEFVDFGNSDKVEASNIRQLSKNFAALPQACIKVTLHDVHLPDIDQNATKTWLEEKVLEHVCRCEIVSIDGECSVSAYVYTEGRDEHINDQIYELFALEVTEEVTEVVTEVAESTAKEIENAAMDSEVPGVRVAEGHQLPTEDTAVKFLEPELSEKESGFCVFIPSALEIKFQLSKYESQLNQLMESLASYSPSAPVLSPCEVMSCCSAKYTVDEQWYRAEVISVDKGQAVVNFIDYGNTESVDIQSLKSLTPAFTSLPRTCVTCILHDVHPDDIDTENAKNWMEENILEQAVDIEVVTKAGKGLESYVFSTNIEGHINDYLYSLFAKEVPEEKTPVIAVQSEQIEATPTQIEAIPINIQLPTLTADTNVNATCYVIDSAIILRCQLSEYQERIDTMMNEVADVAESSPVLNDPKPGDICLAKYTEDEGWYRGQITQDKKVEFVDFGNSDKVEASNIRQLSKNFAALPQACIKVTLHDVHLPDIDQNATKTWLEEKVLEHVCRCEIVSIDGECSVSAYVYTEGRDEHINGQIYELFASEVSEEAIPIDKATAEEPVKIVEDSDAPVSPAGSAKYAGKEIKPANVNEGTTEFVTCTHVESAVLIKCQLASYQDSLDTLTEKFTVLCESSTPSQSLKVGEHCFAKYSVDDLWYRVQVLKVDNGVITVEFIDYGNSSNVAITETCPMMDTFTELPKTCIDIQLHDVHVEDIDIKKTNQWLEETVVNEILKVNIVSVQNGVIDGIVVQEGNDVSINDQIYNNFALEDVVVEDEEPEKVKQSNSSKAVDDEGNKVGNQESTQQLGSKPEAKMQKLNKSGFIEFKWPELLKGTKEKVVCTVAETSNVLMCQLLKTKHKLEQLMDVIAIEIDALPRQRFFEETAACIAQFDDLIWYRAKIIATQEATCTVQFVDYGNIDDVINEDMRVIQPEMMDDEMCCVKCVLSDVEVLPENEDAAVTYLLKTLVEDGPTVEMKIDYVDTENKVATVTLIQEGINVNNYLQMTFGPIENVYREKNIVLGEKMRLSIPETSSLAKFCCICEDTNGELQSLSVMLNKLYKSQTPPSPIAKYEENMPCCFLSGDGNWKRGKVLNVNELVKVFAVDYGTVEDVSTDHILELMSEFFKLELHAFYGTLFDLRPIQSKLGWSAEAIKYFNYACDRRKLTGTAIKVENNIYSLALVLDNGDTVYEMLTKENFAETNERKINQTGLVNGHI